MLLMCKNKQKGSPALFKNILTCCLTYSSTGCDRCTVGGDHGNG